MKSHYSLLLVTLSIFIVTSCSSGHKAYKHGDYYKACLEAVDRLQSNPNSDKSQYVLSKSYPLAIKNSMRQIENANLLNEQNKYDILVNEYSKMAQLAQAIYSSPKANQIIPNPVEYTRELGEAKQAAAESAYDRGLDALDYGTIEQGRLAYNFFLNANEYVYGYKNVLNKIEEARFMGTYRILVQSPLTSQKYQYSADFFYNNLMADLIKTTRNRLIRFYSAEEATSEKMNQPHLYLMLDFQDFSVGNLRESENTIEVKRDSVVVGTVKVEGKTYNSYATVKALLTTFKRDVISGGILSVNIIDANTNRNIQMKNFAGEYVWTSSWANFKGDDRALSQKQIDMCDKKPAFPPAHQDLFVEFTRPIYSQALPYLTSFFNRY